MAGLRAYLRSRGFAWVIMAMLAVLQAACGGGSDTVPVTPPVTADPNATALTVPVSSGYPILGSTVSLKGANGNVVSSKGDSSTGIATFTVGQVSQVGNPPYLIKSTGGTANGVAVPSSSDYYSIATSTTGRFNVTPITHLLAVEATGSGNLAGIATLFASGFTSTKASALTSSAIASALTKVKSALVATNPLVDLGTTDPLTVVFSFGDAHDALLDQIKLTLKGSTGATLDSIQTVVAGGSSAAAAADAIKPFRRVIVFGDSLSDGGAYTVWASAAASGANRFVGTTPLQMLAAAAPYGGKFTTNGGKVWVENIASDIGYDMKPANLMGGNQASMDLSKMGCTTCTNYAQGGSRVSLQPGIGNIGTTANPANAAVAPLGFAGNSAGASVAATPVLLGAATADYTVTNKFLGASTIPVVQQIDQHLASTYATAGKFAATDLVIVMAGANDVFTQAGLAGANAITSDAAGAAVGKAASDLVAQVARIKAAGARFVMVVGLPNMGQTPAGVAQGAAAAAALTALSQSVFNPTVKAGLATVGKVAYLDPVPMFSAVVANPSTYGFTKVIDTTSPATAIASQACGPNAIAQAAAGDSATSPSSLFCSAANASLGIVGTLRALLADQTYAFADGVHPTTQMHKVLANHVRQKMGLLLAEAI